MQRLFGNLDWVHPTIATATPLPCLDNGNNLENMLYSHRETLMAVAVTSRIIPPKADRRCRRRTFESLHIVLACGP